jgi:hypothetical protein
VVDPRIANFAWHEVGPTWEPGHFAENRGVAVAEDKTTKAILSKKEILPLICGICANQNSVNETTSLMRAE